VKTILAGVYYGLLGATIGLMLLAFFGCVKTEKTDSFLLLTISFSTLAIAVRPKDL